MNIIYGKYRIHGGAHSWELQKYRTRKDKTGESKVEWESFQWFGSLQAALNALAEHRIRSLDVNNIAEALDEVKQLITALSQAIPPIFELKVHGEHTNG